MLDAIFAANTKVAPLSTYLSNEHLDGAKLGYLLIGAVAIFILTRFLPKANLLLQIAIWVGIFFVFFEIIPQGLLEGKHLFDGTWRFIGAELSAHL